MTRFNRQSESRSRIRVGRRLSSTPEFGVKPGPLDADTTGAVVNYTLFGSAIADQSDFGAAWRTRSNFSAAFDGRAFGPFGVFSQSGLMNNAISPATQSVRLESTWCYSDTESLRTYRAGDIVSGGLSWTRSVRLGGVQVQRNFGLRPDLVTLPMPQYSASAALPSTVDIFVNNVRGYSGAVAPGPFQIPESPGHKRAPGIRALLCRTRWAGRP